MGETTPCWRKIMNVVLFGLRWCVRNKRRMEMIEVLLDARWQYLCTLERIIGDLDKRLTALEGAE